MSLLVRPPLDRLAALVRNCAASGTSRQVLLLYLSRLPTSLMRPHHLRLAEAALAPLLQLPRAETFRLPGPLIAVSWRGNGDGALLDVVETLEHLLADTSPARPDLTELISVFDVPECGELLLDAASSSALTESMRPGPAPTVPLDPALLTTLEGCLQHADIARFARRRPVWWLAGEQMTLAWEERTLSLAELTAELSPGCDLRADPWLFGRLTRTLDKRLLALLSSTGELAAASPFAIDLNVASVLSQDFLRFDAALPVGLRRQITIALSPADMAADAGSVPLATAFAKARGYRLLLRSNGSAAARMVAPALRVFDHVAIHWSPTLSADDLPGMRERIVLTRCNTPEAVQWGLDTGVIAFRGAAADEVALA